MFLKKWFKPKPGTPCWIVSKENDIKKMVKGTVLINHKDAILIDYEWIDNTGHSLIAGQDDFYVINSADGLPIFFHNVGDLFCCNCRFDGQIGSEYFHTILRSDIGSKMLTTLQEVNDNPSLPWGKILLIGGIIIGVLFLWQTGIIDQLLATITGSLPSTTPSGSPSPGIDNLPFK